MLTLSLGPHADATTLKLLQIPELHSWMVDNNVAIPKSKLKNGALYIFNPKIMLTLAQIGDVSAQLAVLKKQLAKNLKIFVEIDHLKS